MGRYSGNLMILRGHVARIIPLLVTYLGYLDLCVIAHKEKCSRLFVSVCAIFFSYVVLCGHNIILCGTFSHWKFLLRFQNCFQINITQSCTDSNYRNQHVTIFWIHRVERGDTFSNHGITNAWRSATKMAPLPLPWQRNKPE